MTTADAGHSPENQSTSMSSPSDEPRAIAVPEGGDQEEIAALKERLQFYESFDRLISENVTRSSELLREAIDLRERTEIERAELQKATEQALATERQHQRDSLSSVLQDLISLQQLTERLAQRVTDALESVEAQLEPPGLRAGTALPRAGDEEPPDLLSLGAQPARREAGEAVTEPFGEATASAADEASVAGQADLSGAETDTPFAEPVEVADEEILEDVTLLDAPESGASPVEPEIPDVESFPGEGEESAPTEMREAAWSQPEAPEPHEAGPTAEGTNWFATGATPLTGLSEPGGTLDAAAAAANQTAPDAPQASTLNGSRPATPSSAPADSSTATVSPRQDSEERATDRGPFRTVESAPETAAQPEPLAENQPQTLIIEGIPTAALALSLHRYLHDLPTVRSVETREFHSGQLRLNVVATPRITLDDLRRWPQGTTIEPIREEPDILEVRLQPIAAS